MWIANLRQNVFTAPSDTLALEHWLLLAAFTVWLLAFALLDEGIRLQRWAANFMTLTAEYTAALELARSYEEEERRAHAPRGAEERPTDPDHQARLESLTQAPTGDDGQGGDTDPRSPDGLAWVAALAVLGGWGSRQSKPRVPSHAQPPDPGTSMTWAIRISTFVLMTGFSVVMFATPSGGAPFFSFVSHHPEQALAWPLIGTLTPAFLATIRFATATSFAQAARASGTLPKRSSISGIVGLISSAVSFAGAIASLISLGLR